METAPLFLDFEASSLSFDSYPIEVAWAGEHADPQAFLISPETIPEWTDWSRAAQNIHRIKPKTLLRQGISPMEAASKISTALENKTVYTDNPDFDGMWMKALFDGVHMAYPKINILHLDALLIETICPDLDHRIQYLPKIIEFKIMARNKIRIQHRAAQDVQYLLELFKLAKAFSHSQTG